MFQHVRDFKNTTQPIHQGTCCTHIDQPGREVSVDAGGSQGVDKREGTVEGANSGDQQRVTLDAGDFCGVGDDIQRCVHRLNYSTDRIVYTYRTYSAIFIDNIV